MNNLTRRFASLGPKEFVPSAVVPAARARTIRIRSFACHAETATALRIGRQPHPLCAATAASSFATLASQLPPSPSPSSPCSYAPPPRPASAATALRAAGGRSFSDAAATASAGTAPPGRQPRRSLSPTSATIVPTTDAGSGDGRQLGVILDTRRLPKLRPGVVQRRLADCRTYVGRETAIRQSPWKLNRICQLAAGLTLEEALTQLKFCPLKNADLVAKVLKRTSNLADIRDSLQMSQLEVSECFTTKAMMLRRIKPMGRGRHGVMHHKYSHIRVVLREIDFPLKIYQERSLNQKQKWLLHQQRAERDGRAAQIKREEMERLMRQQEEQLQERRVAAAKQGN